MARLPVSYQIAIRCESGGPYSGRVTAWGLGDTGEYGSMWTRRVDLTAPRDADSRQVLLDLAAALVALLDRAEG